MRSKKKRSFAPAIMKATCKYGKIILMAYSVRYDTAACVVSTYKTVFETNKKKSDYSKLYRLIEASRDVGKR